MGWVGWIVGGGVLLSHETTFTDSYVQMYHRDGV